MDHPFMKALKSNTSGSRVSIERIVSFKSCIFIGQYQQTRAIAMQAVHLQITGILADIGIEKDVLGMCLIEILPVHVIIEWERDTH